MKIYMECIDCGKQYDNLEVETLTDEHVTVPFRLCYECTKEFHESKEDESKHLRHK